MPHVVPLANSDSVLKFPRWRSFLAHELNTINSPPKLTQSEQPRRYQDRAHLMLVAAQPYLCAGGARRTRITCGFGPSGQRRVCRPALLSIGEATRRHDG